MLAGSGEGLTMKNGMAECKYCGHTTSVSPSVRQVSRAYDRHHSNPASRFRALNVLLVVSDCTLIGLQPILVYMSKVDGKFLFDPVSVNFLTELAKVAFAVCMLLFAVRKQHPGEKSLLSPVVILQAARANYLLAVPALLYAINNYLKFIMQLYFNPATVKMLSNLKVLMIALLLKVVMRRRFTIMQWEALGLLLIGISVNQLHTTSTGTTSIAVPVAGIAYAYTLIFVTVPSLASVYNEYALKSQFDTSVHLQNLFLYGYGAFFNLCGIVIRIIYNGTTNFNLVEGHSKATAFLILNNAAQGILSSFFFKYAEVFLREGFPLKRVLKAIGDTILKKYSSTVATIFTGLASAALFGHTLTINFVLGVSIVFISMHQFFSSLPKKDSHIREEELDGTSKKLRHDSSFVNMTAGATEEASHKIGVHSEREPLLPT